jgi:FkbM family methyltransferase
MVYHALHAGQSPGVMIDVGAHIGGSLASFAAAGWSVWAFEPDSANRKQLEQTIRSRPDAFAGVVISPLAVSDVEKEGVAFYTSAVSTGISGLVAFHESHAETARVNTTTLDRFIEAEGIYRIDFLKIDVEGHELSVLRGLNFDKVKPRAIVAEFEDGKTRQSGYDTQGLVEFLQDRGYTVFLSEWHPISQYGRRHSWCCIRKTPYQPGPDAWGNLVAFLDEPPADVLESAAAAARARPSGHPAIRSLRRALGRALRAVGMR